AAARGADGGMGTAAGAGGTGGGGALRGEAVSEPFTIDNTPPQVTSLEAKAGASGVELSGAAEDGEGWLQRLDLAIDDGAWHSLSPDGGLSDQPKLTFRTVLTDLAPGPHLLSLRAVDAAGNAATRAVRVTGAAKKRPPPAVFERLLEAARRACDGGRALADVRAIARFHRIQSSPGYDAAADWLEEAIRGAGLVPERVRFAADGR